MGAVLACIRSWSGAGGSDDELENEQLLSFDIACALEPLPANVYLRRPAEIIPPILISAAEFLALQHHIPPQHQRRKWQQIFSTKHDGFSKTALQRQCADSIAGGQRKSADPCIILLLAAGCRFGAFLSTIPDFSRKRYYGTEDTFLFSFEHEDGSLYVAGDSSCMGTETAVGVESPDGDTELKESSSTRLPSGNFQCHREGISNPSGPTVRLNIFRSREVSAASDDAPKNAYYIRTEEGKLVIGGGGSGPAIMVYPELDIVKCTGNCQTFDMNGVGLLDAAVRAVQQNGHADIPGFSIEGSDVIAAVTLIEVWTLSPNGLFVV